MVTSEIRLWPGVPDLHALGAKCFEDLMGASGELEGESLGEVQGEREGWRLLRYPLPGTMHAPGQKPSRPRGAGTGMVDLIRWSGGSLGSRMGTRFQTPRSASFAAHAWNLICHLREAGVGTAEPLAMGQENSAVFAKRSFLVTRALEPMQPLTDYLAANKGGEVRRHLLHALGLFLRRVQLAGVELPELGPRALFVTRLSATKVDACAIQKIHVSMGGTEPKPASPVPGFETRALPELALAQVHGGRIHGKLSIEERADHLAQLGMGPGVRELFSPRDLLRILHHALPLSLDRKGRRQAMVRLTRKA
jgi:hypothetical protein